MDIYNNLCRSCNIEKEKLMNIHDVQEPAKLIKNMLEYTLQTAVTNESKYPEFICYDCLKQLEISYRFIKRFHLSQSEFEESFSRLEKNFAGSSDRCINEDTIAETYCEKDSKNYHEHSMPFVIDLPRNDAKPIKQVRVSQRLPVTNVPSETRKPPRIICSICNKMFFTQKALNMHLKLSHKQNIPYF